MDHGAVPSQLTFDFRSCSGEFSVPAPASLLQDQVHVWRAPLPAPASAIPGLARLLAADENERAGHIRSQALHNDFLFARGMLRTLLGGYLDIPHAELRFAYSSHGKPSLAPPAHALSFNLSHTEGMVVFAFARQRRLGIDVEKIRRDFQVQPIAERFFSLTELLALRDLPEEQRHQAFFRCWTCKEAYIKARGEGLSHPLHQFDVAVSPAQPVALLSTRPDPGEADRWLLREVPLPSDHVAALAVELQPAPPG
jgi:4'-phosphopantetheinyl transferase